MMKKLPRNEFCQRVFFGLFELLAFILVVTLATWYAQSKTTVVNFNDDPGYRILAVTHDYIDVKWIEAALQTDCPGRVEPMIVGEYASHSHEPYPFVVQHKRTTFTRRYEIPEYFPEGDYELRINMVAICNPLFETRQVLRVPFKHNF